MSLCHLCPLSASVQVMGHGPKDAKLIVLGEFPNNTDEKAGYPFAASSRARTEKASELLRNFLEKGMGLDPEKEVYFVYALRCNPYHNRNQGSDGKKKKKKSLGVNEKHLKACRHHLDAELKDVTAPLVLVLGKYAALAVLDDQGALANYRVKAHHVDLGGQRRTAYVTFSPREVDARSLWHVTEAEPGKFTRGKRWVPTGSTMWFFKRDLARVRDALAATLPVAE